jgi:uncharacterized Tic20 family protein
MKLLLALISLIGPIIAWMIKNDAESKQEKKERKQEIKDAIASGDISRIHAVIDRLRH